MINHLAYVPLSLPPLDSAWRSAGTNFTYCGIVAQMPSTRNAQDETKQAITCFKTAPPQIPFHGLLCCKEKFAPAMALYHPAKFSPPLPGKNYLTWTTVV